MSKIMETAKDAKKRLHLAMPRSTQQVIDNLQKRTGAESMTEIFRRALALLDVVTAKQEEGGQLYIHWPDGRQSEIHIL
jgi:hypothetical protein